MVIFQYTWKKVLNGEKTQTRRLWQPLHYTRWDDGRQTVMRVLGVTAEEYTAWQRHYQKSSTPEFFKTRVQWKIGRTYALQRGRGKPAVARIRITNIWPESLQNITEEDARAEGFHTEYCPVCGGDGSAEDGECIACGGTGIFASARDEFIRTWRMIHTARGTRWDDDPLVWVLEFELEEVL